MITYVNHTMKYALGIALLALVLTANVGASVSFSPQITAGCMYTDNGGLVSENEEPDFITMLSPGATVNLTGRNAALSLSYHSTYAAYTRFPEFNNIRHNAVIDARDEIASKTRLEFGNRYLYTEDPISDTDMTVRRGRTPYFSNTANLGVINQFGMEDSIALRYEYFILNNRDPAVEDRQYQRPNLLLTYWMLPNQYATELELRYTRSDFETLEDFGEALARLRLTRRFGRHFNGYVECSHGNTDYVAESEDYKILSPLIGFRWDEFIISSFSASFGYFRRDGEHGGDDTGFVGSVETVYRWDVGNTVMLSGIAGQDRSSFDTENLGFRSFYTVSCTMNYQLSRLIIGAVSSGYRRDIYPEQDPEREDATWRAGTGIAFQVLPWMAFRLDYLFRKLDSEIEVNSYIENRGMISVIIGPRQGILLTQ